LLTLLRPVHANGTRSGFFPDRAIILCDLARKVVFSIRGVHYKVWMKRYANISCMMTALLLSLPLLAIHGASAGELSPRHAIAMHGEPGLPPGFDHFPYANADAPQGGEMRYGVLGTFDSLNPFILSSMRTTARGMWDTEIGKLVFEPLMVRSADEPFTLYGLLAESVTMPEDRSWMEFTLNDRAAWADGQPITPEDVIFSFELLRDHGRPPFSSRMNRIEKIERTASRKVKFTFNEKSDREFPLIVAGFTPILPKHATDVANFDSSTLTPPLGSGPYRIGSVEPGSRIVFEKRQDYWGAKLPVNRGQLNFDRITVEYFRSMQSRFEAFKKGIFDVYPEGDPAAWRRAYDFHAVNDGRVIKESFESRTPATMFGFAFNTRRPVFENPTVRKALAGLFDFEWVNRNLFFSAYERTGSYWHGSALSALGVPASEEELMLLEPYPNAVEPTILAGTWRPAASDGSGRDRKVLREAYQLLAEAGYSRSGDALVDQSGQPLAFEILTKSEEEERLAIAYKRSLESLGIAVSLRSVDDAQYQRRTQDFDYDMILVRYSSSLAPGAEQVFRWGSGSRNLAGSFNYAGASDPAIDAMIKAMIDAHDRETFVAAVRALDRVLLSGHYLAPLFHLPEQWIARWSHVSHPQYTPIYGNQYTAWWDRRAAD
jgi:peptide/nickel transport system substrate-binding protein